MIFTISPTKHIKELKVVASNYKLLHRRVNVTGERCECDGGLQLNVTVRGMTFMYSFNDMPRRMPCKFNGRQSRVEFVGEDRP